jgi:uncharacterized protein (UPF0276 family)
MMLPAIGYALREQNRYILDDPSINAVEVTFERADDPLRVARYIGDEIDFDHVSVHALKLSPGSPDRPALHYLSALKAICEENGATSVSDHLGFTRDADGGVEMGHFAPVPMTAEALDTCSRNLEFCNEYFRPLDFYIENIAYLFRLEGTLKEADFISRMLDRTGVGLLLDVTNVYVNAENFKFSARDFIAQVVEHAPKVQMHLAGGIYDERLKMHLDTHSEPIPEGVFELYRYALEQGHGKVSSVFVERDQNYPGEEGWRGEIGRVKQIAVDVEAKFALA